MMEPDEVGDEFTGRIGPPVVGRSAPPVPDFACAPSWVRTFYWTPLVGWLARRWIERHEAYRPAEPPSPGELWDDSGVHEPRRPRPFAGAGAVEAEEPFEDEDEGGLDDGYALVGFDEPGAPTTAA
jgi:hypothetical protein